MKSRKKFSLRSSVLLCVLFSIIPIDLLFIFLMRQSIYTLYDKTADSYLITLQTAADQLSSDLSEIEQSMANLYIEDYYVRYLKKSASEGSRYRYGYSLMEDAALSVPNQGITFVYDGLYYHYRKGDMLGSDGYVEYSALSRHLIQNIDAYENHWFITEWKESWYMIRLIGTEGVYLGKIIPLNRTLLENYLHIPEPISACFAGLDGVPLDGEATAAFLSADIRPLEEYSFFSGNNDLSIQSTKENLPLQLLAFLPASYLNEQLSGMRNAFLVFLLLSVFAIAFVSFTLYKRLTLPLAELRDTIQKIRQSDYKAVPPKQAAAEIQEVYDTFNNMTGEIRELRIQTYEELLARQKFEMQYRSLQLKPHFYLNCLKSLYGLAEKGNIADIQNMVLRMSEQFQFMAYDMTSTISLQDELTHTQNYINIQKLGKGFPIHAHLSFDRTMEQVPVPALCIQTFVENSIKYAPQLDRALTIDISIAHNKTENGEYLHITVRDNGNGYPDEILETIQRAGIQKEIEIPQEQQHIGLLNLMVRLRIIYKEEAFLYLSNQSGAVSELMIPIEAKGVK